MITDKLKDNPIITMIEEWII